MPDTPELEFLALQEALVGRYSLQRELGRGGMGVVYLAHEVRLDRPVALKLLPTHLAAQPVLRDRFLQEARTAAKLSHPNIVPIYAVDEVGDFVFFAMAFVEGESLGQRVRERGPLRPAEAARILREVAWALGYAHGQGVVHRDIKPDNILLEAQGGRAMVTDFGIAHVSGSQGLTGVTEILGTAEFMSPEQASGDIVDGRSDLYALGIVGHYMLSGELPFQGSHVAATLAKQLTQEAPALATVAPEVPRQLCEAMDRCLAKDPADRFAGGEELAEAMSLSLQARREMPVALRVFAEQNRESSTAIVGSTVLALVMWVLVIATAIQAIVPGFRTGLGLNLIEALLTWGIFGLAIGVVPVVMLRQMARRLLQAGHGYDELVLALRIEVEERREEVESTVRAKPTWADRLAKRLAFGSLGVCAGVFVATPFALEYLEVFATVFGISSMTLLGTGLFSATRHHLRGTVPGRRWLKFWESRVGKWVFKLAGRGLGRISAVGAHYGHTEMAIGLAADRLFDGLPKDVQGAFSELPEVVRTLEQDAEKMRSRIKELDALINQTEGEEGIGSGARVAESSDVADKRLSLAEDLRRARDAADTRLSEVVAALETIRLELLRLHAGAGSVESMTADLSSARELSQDIERVLEGGREVERLLGSD